MPVCDRQRGLTAERRDPGEQLVQHDAGRIHIGTRVRNAALDLLRAEVGDGADQHALGCLADRRGRGRAGEAEVGDLHRAGARDQDVLWLDVPMDEAGGVRGAQCGEHRLDHVERINRRQRTALAQQVANGLPVDVLHDEVDQLVVLALVVDPDDVRVAQPGRRAGLADEAADELRVFGERRVHHLDGDRALEPGVHGLVDRRHAAPGEAGHNAISTVEKTADKRVGQGRVHRVRVPSTRLRPG